MVRLIALFVVMVVVSTSVGCSHGGVDFTEHNDTNVERVRNMYAMYMSSNSMRGPKNKEQLKKFITTNNRARILMERIGLNRDEFDNYFTGTRDKEELVVRWGLRGGGHAIAFEKTGVDGMRFIALGDAKEFDEDAYESWLDGSTKPATPQGAAELEPAAEDLMEKAELMEAK